MPLPRTPLRFCLSCPERDVFYR
uniref:Uncharacterized protein n=1 Tax=Nelumbo nucifera TaxID=4432 RepID=A0A822Z6G7_NELNU|nr:TPA_asm: hypothetical protein HUJ06_013388 [Nelumbo nucifera]